MTILKRLRVSFGLSAKDILNKLGMHKANFSAIENGKRYVSQAKLNQILQALGVDPKYWQDTSDKYYEEAKSNENWQIKHKDKKVEQLLNE